MKDGKTKKLLIVAGVCLVIVLIIGIVIYRSGKKTGKAQGSINLSTPVTDDAGTGSPAASTSEIRQLVQRVHDDLDGLNALGHDSDLWSRVLTLSDADFTRLYNDFNYAYQRDSGQTLKQWVEDDGDYFYQIGSQWGTIKKTVLSKMSKLNFV